MSSRARRLAALGRKGRSLSVSSPQEERRNAAEATAEALMERYKMLLCAIPVKLLTEVIH